MDRKRILGLAAAAALAATLGLAGCNQAPASSASQEAPQTAAPSSSEAAAPATTSADAASDAAAPSAAAPSAAAPGATASSAAANAQGAAASAASAMDSYIGDEAAIAAALTHAGFKQDEVVALKCELDLDDRVVHYDVEFKQGNMEYDSDIDALTGEVIFFNSEIDD